MHSESDHFHSLVQTTTISCLDERSSLSVGLPTPLHPAGQVILDKCQSDHVTSLPKNLQWLLIMSKLLILVYKALRDLLLSTLRLYFMPHPLTTLL